MNKNGLRVAELWALSKPVMCGTLFKHLDINSHRNLLMVDIEIKSTM